MNVEQRFLHGSAESVEGDPATAAALRRRRLMLVAIGIAIIATIAIVAWLRSGDATPTAEVLPRVTVIAPGRQLVENEISATGNLAARREMPVGVQGEGGMVLRVLVEPGDWVEAGQALAVIDRAVQVQQVNQMQAQVVRAVADERLAQEELERAAKLVSRGFISQADIDRKTATRDAARAQVRVAQAQYAEMRARLGRLDIRAPAAGLVLSRDVEPGQVVAAGGPALFRIAEGGRMEMLARLPEQDLARLGVGQPAEVTPVGSPRAYPGTIWQISPIIDPETRQGVARVALAYDRAIRPGGFAAARIRSGQVEAPLLPESAVQGDSKGNFVYLVGRDGVVARRDVVAGEASDKGITILSGISGSEQVVLSAGAFLNPGDRVEAVRASAPPRPRG